MILLLPVVPLPLPDKVQRYQTYFIVRTIAFCLFLEPEILSYWARTYALKHIIENELRRISQKENPDHAFILLKVDASSYRKFLLLNEKCKL